MHWQLQAFCWNLLDCFWMTEHAYHWAWFFSSTYKKVLWKNGNVNGQEKEKSELKKKKKKPTLSIDICSQRQKMYKHIIPDSSYTRQFLKVLKWTLMKDSREKCPSAVGCKCKENWIPDEVIWEEHCLPRSRANTPTQDQLFQHVPLLQPFCGNPLYTMR